MRMLGWIAVWLLLLAWATSALAAHGPARAGAAPSGWMASTCAALSTLQHGVAERWSTATPAKSRASLIALLARDAADTDGVLLATSRSLPGVPHGAAIAATLNGRAFGLHRYISVRRSAAQHAGVGAMVAASRAGLLARSKEIGGAFVHLERSYPSAALVSAIDQAPSCALVHG